MLAEVLPDALVGGNPSILADDLHCQDFRITQQGKRILNCCV